MQLANMIRKPETVCNNADNAVDWTLAIKRRSHCMAFLSFNMSVP